MTTTAALCAMMLAPDRIDDDRFFEATALLSTRFDRRSEHGDLREDPEAPKLLFDWFAHANERVPDWRVWDMSCRLEDYFDPDFGLYLPRDWPWHTRDTVLMLTAELRARAEWVPAVEQALFAPGASSVRSLACCAAERAGRDPFEALWAYLCEHVEEGGIWCLVEGHIDESRLPDYLRLARATLISGHGLEGGCFFESSRCVPVGLSPAVEGTENWLSWRSVLTLLQRFPGEGVELVERALRSCDLGVRLKALELLAIYWSEVRLPADTVNLLRELAEAEPHEIARRRFEELLQGV